MSKNDYYEVLEVQKSADAAEIKKAYLKLAKNITQIKMPTILMLKRNLRKLAKRMTL